MRRLEGGPGAAAAPQAAPLVPGSVAPPPALATVVVPGATAVPAAPAPGALTPPRGADVMTEQQSYDAAFDQFKAGNYGGAVIAFQGFVKTYPRSPLAPSAQYWIGNAQYAQREFAAAIATQRQLIRNYPDSQKVPDALLNIATNQLELNDVAGARKTFDEIIAKYPQSDAAEKARKRTGAAR
jgi:tol-pal system protein YbgF